MCHNDNHPFNMSQSGGCGCSHYAREETRQTHDRHHAVDLILPDVPTPDPAILSQAGEALLRRWRWNSRPR